ncbi:MAG: nucleotide exchange factor GrpE [Lachnospiraceae bacterium]
MVYKQLAKALADMGVEPIEAVGKPFDPNLHNAVMHVEDENLRKTQLLRSSKVILSWKCCKDILWYRLHN